MTKIAVFSIKESFQITNRGLVAVGKLVEGYVKTGQKIILKIENQILELKISGVETGKLNNEGESFIGLWISNDNPNMSVELKDVKLEAQEVEIFE